MFQQVNVRLNWACSGVIGQAHGLDEGHNFWLNGSVCVCVWGGAHMTTPAVFFFFFFSVRVEEKEKTLTSSSQPLPQPSPPLTLMFWQPSTRRTSRASPSSTLTLPHHHWQLFEEVGAAAPTTAPSTSVVSAENSKSLMKIFFWILTPSLSLPPPSLHPWHFFHIYSMMPTHILYIFIFVFMLCGWSDSFSPVLVECSRESYINRLLNTYYSLVCWWYCRYFWLWYMSTTNQVKVLWVLGTTVLTAGSETTLFLNYCRVVLHH